LRAIPYPHGEFARQPGLAAASLRAEEADARHACRRLVEGADELLKFFFATCEHRAD
jgi:hypothetical protein